ncbi:MAG: hypothetical protein E7319_08835 [Clostridiales bacterium]|nr:hypothetical protein [Clostridiales bacterium]
MIHQPLLQDITDQIKEAQIKLGFSPNAVRLYYTVPSLCRLTGAVADDAESLCRLLSGEAFFSSSPLGALTFVPDSDRIAVTTPAQGVRYVHEHVDAPAFLLALIGLFAGHHHVSVEELTALFASQQSPYARLDMPPGNDFSFALYFPDGQPDRYYYFISEEMGHLSYHRFRPEDALPYLS